jgi:hypothetical protein
MNYDNAVDLKLFECGDSDCKFIVLADTMINAINLFKKAYNYYPEVVRQKEHNNSIIIQNYIEPIYNNDDIPF